MDSFVVGSGEFLDEEDPNDSSRELDASITTPPLLKGGSLNEGNWINWINEGNCINRINRKTEFMAFLRLLEKQTNDIRRLDKNFFKKGTKMKVYWDRTVSELENSTLGNKIKRKSFEGTKEQREDMVHTTLR